MSFIISFIFTILRIYAPSMSELNLDIFKAFAHIWIGILYSGWFFCRRFESVGDLTTYFHASDSADCFQMQAIGLTIWEVFCFFIFK